jgi:aminoglycoside phosphotransferase (APT) family kinase protein
VTTADARLGPLIASGRDSDVFAYGDGLVLRRYRDGRPAEEEAAVVRAVAGLGYPVPVVHGSTGPDIVMERVDGPTLAEALLRGLSPDEAGAVLADLHDRLHAIAWPDAGPGECLLHLDLHPLNVIMRGTEPAGPVVIDWSNARPGPAGLDVAMTAVILAQVLVTDGLLEAIGLAGDDVLPALTRLLQVFAVRVGTPYADRLADAEALRRQDRYQSAAERAALPRAVDLAASLAGGSA